MIQAIYREQGATLAPDGIPLHFGNLKGEYHAALEGAILLDRSHEGRIEIRGKDRFEILNRTSTNDLLNMRAGEARPTIFTNPNGRILERVVVFNWREDSILVLTGPGRGEGVANYLQRQIFYNDDAQITDLATTHYQFSLHGPTADAVIDTLAGASLGLDVFAGQFITVDDVDVFAGKLKPLSTNHWIVLCTVENAPQIWNAIHTAGEAHGLIASGGLTYNTLRIRAGVPGAGREISNAYIPLEVGLWDEVSFNKGCYTGQEIIARMESRQQLAKTLVKLVLTTVMQAPVDLYADGKKAGILTSSVSSPDDEHFGMGIIKTAYATPGQTLTVGEDSDITVTVGELLGVQPEWISKEAH